MAVIACRRLAECVSDAQPDSERGLNHVRAEDSQQEDSPWQSAVLMRQDLMLKLLSLGGVAGPT